MPRNRRSNLIAQPAVTKIGAGKNWLLLEDYELYVDGLLFKIPKGFVFDLASVPECLHWLIDEDELGLAAPCIHDAIYRCNGELPQGWVYPEGAINRKEADNLLYWVAMLSGAPHWRASAAYYAVRMFSRRW